MSLILKGIDLPKSCGECEFNYNLEGGSYEWWECVILHDDINQFDTRRTDCPLIEIPTPHGRLIDADALETVFKDMAKCEWNQKAFPISWAYAFEDTIDEIDNAPTILEAEE